jgi:hypothetical protein
MTLARYYARKEVLLANAHLASHPELIERAAKTVHGDPALRRIAERHEQERPKRASA